MTFQWLKRYMPRTLYGRAALILLLPVITIQLTVSVVFLQRHFEGVTEQMTRNVVRELGHIITVIEQAPGPERGLSQVEALARDLNIGLTLPAPRVIRGDRRRVYDLSGRAMIATLRAGLPGLTGIDLASDEKQVEATVRTRAGLLGFSMPRSRVTASNPHQLLVLMVAVSLLMTVIAYLFLKNQLRPIARLAHAASAFGKGRTLPYRPAGASEVRAAGSAFLDMRNRIERQIEQRTLMLSGVSHDLRTPLTRMRLGLAMLEPEDEAEALLGDVEEMEKMLASFLDFAAGDALDDPAQIEPEALIAELVEKARRAGHVVDAGPVQCEGLLHLRPLAITRALDNLIGNAVRHGSRARISCTTGERAAVFSVEDDGPGIAPELRDDALKPFSRLDTARNQNRGGGVGLGLSIAMDIARQHGGTLRLASSPELGGLKADLVIAR
ncbi:ATP-binding protein [Profundibacterium mesophilum]|uniref:histidine kinase n=1 Tax=Profundibacterium mesophilum KAUST100406-0324 TaxID=1037889 RepID=A0A921NWV4_9RHOB|nr:ATP-binding protein [Profundibacterium mesophilum]KAF0677148.1 Two component sensor kinase [Profundibacterium mesophilum KAUST100406-0324]